jgi:hypothetical protein
VSSAETVDLVTKILILPAKIIVIDPQPLKFVTTLNTVIADIKPRHDVHKETGYKQPDRKGQKERQDPLEYYTASHIELPLFKTTRNYFRQRKRIRIQNLSVHRHGNTVRPPWQ